MTLWAARLGAFLFVVAMGAYGLWRIEDARGDTTARQCIAAWQGREDIRDMGETGYRRNATTLIGLATTANPERIEAYRDQVERDVEEIRSALPNPDCDLDEARRRLE